LTKKNSKTQLRAQGKQIKKSQKDSRQFQIEAMNMTMKEKRVMKRKSGINKQLIRLLMISNQYVQGKARFSLRDRVYLRWSYLGNLLLR